MFRKAHWFNPWTSKPKNPLSLEHLRHLCNVMSKNSIVSEQNKTLLVETLRQIAEILIWGDQNDSTVFDFFLERNMLSFFLDIMKQRCGNYVTVQLLQTLNILFENIRHETSLYYLLSNNHVNSIIMHKFDLSDEEVMAYYISFLKTLSFKLNPHTIHFFFNTSDFPLYTEAIKYFNHPEKMVRIAVRILTLNVFKVDEKSMLKFITSQTVPCLSDLVHFIKDNVINIEKCLRDSPSSSPTTPQPGTISLTLMQSSQVIQEQNLSSSPKACLKNSAASNIQQEPQSQQPQLLKKNNPIKSYSNSSLNININNNDKLLLKLDDLFAEHLDHLHYLNDILMLKIDDINTILSENLMHHLIKPLVDAYKDDPHNSMIRLFTLEFTTSILSKVLATSLFDEEIPDDDVEDDDDDDGNNDGRRLREGGENLKNASDESRDRLANDVKDCNNKQDLTNDKLSSTQLAIIEQSKEIAEIKVKTLLKNDTKMTYLSLFDSEYNDMKRKRLTIDYLLMDGPASSSCCSSSHSKQFKLDKIINNKFNNSGNNRSISNKKLNNNSSSGGNSSNNNNLNNNNNNNSKITSIEQAAEMKLKLELERARYQIRDFLLWRQLLLNIRNEKDRELSLKNTSWLSYAKLLQWLE